MRGSEPEDGRHSSAERDARPRPWLQVIGALSLFGFLIGLMIGRLLQPDPARLERIEPTARGVDLWFNRAPNLRAEPFDGAFILRVETFGREQQGQLQLDGKAVNWSLKREGRDMLLRFVAARRLQGAWRGEVLEGGWRLSVGLEEQ